MFQPLQVEISARFASVEAYYAATKEFKGTVAANAKGHMFVEAYAIYEFTVKAAVRTAVDSINSQQHRLSEIHPALLALYLDPELRALRDAGNKNIWAARQRIFERAFSRQPAAISLDTKPPDDGRHFRYSHLQMILAVFGIRRRPLKNLQQANRINEVVDNRNEIAHGNDTAENVGRRYTRAEVLQMLRQMKSVCSRVVRAFDSYCSDPSLQRRR